MPTKATEKRPHCISLRDVIAAKMVPFSNVRAFSGWICKHNKSYPPGHPWYIRRWFGHVSYDDIVAWYGKDKAQRAVEANVARRGRP